MGIEAEIPKTSGGLFKPPKGTPDYDFFLNQNFDMIDEKVTELFDRVDGAGDIEVIKDELKADLVNLISAAMRDIIVIQDAAPEYEAARLWVNTNDNTINYRKDGSWESSVGVWGKDDPEDEQEDELEDNPEGGGE